MKDFSKQVSALAARKGSTPLALVTGASSGMGLMYAETLARSGCDILAVSNQQELLPSLAQRLHEEWGVKAIARYQDLSTPDAADALLQFCDDNALEVDILINNAGMFFFKELDARADRKRIDTILHLHMLTIASMTILFGDRMKKRGYGYMMNVSSLAASLPVPGITLYASTKSFLKVFTQSYHYELRPYGVGLTVVCPPAVATPLYGLKPSLMKLGVHTGVIKTPSWLVRRALRGMFRRRRTVRPGLMNWYLPPLIHCLPGALVSLIWKKVR